MEENAKRFTRERWEVINLPLSWINSVVKAFLAGWSCTVETSFRAGKTRSAIVWSAEPLPHHRSQHDFGCALIWPAEPRMRPRVQALVWSKPGTTTEEGQKAAKSLASVARIDPRKATVVPVPVMRPVAAKRPLARGESMDTTDVGAISPSPVQDCSQAPTQVMLSPRSQRVGFLADITAQLQGLMASVQSIATTVGQLGGQMQSLQAEVTEMKNAENRGRRARRARRFLFSAGRRRGCHCRCSRQAEVSICQTCAVLSHLPPGARRGTRMVSTVSVASDTIWWSACVVALARRPATPSRHRRARLRAFAARRMGKMRTRWPRRRWSRRVAPYTAVRVGEASHPGPLFTKHLTCQHCSTWLSQSGSLREQPYPPPLLHHLLITKSLPSCIRTWGVHFAGRRTQCSSPVHGAQTVRSVPDRNVGGQRPPDIAKHEGYMTVQTADWEAEWLCSLWSGLPSGSPSSRIPK